MQENQLIKTCLSWRTRDERSMCDVVWKSRGESGVTLIIANSFLPHSRQNAITINRLQRSITIIFSLEFLKKLRLFEFIDDTMKDICGSLNSSPSKSRAIYTIYHQQPWDIDIVQKKNF